MNRSNIAVRSALLRRTRAFFHSAGYLEVDTPSLSPALIPEAHIDPFVTEFTDPYQTDYRVPLYLTPSPEVYIKPLLGEVGGRLFQLGHCFRNAESVGAQHSPEFTMLEYYECPADESGMMLRTGAYLRSLLSDPIIARSAQRSGVDRLLSAEPLKLSIAQAFERFAGVELTEDDVELRESCRNAGVAVEDSWLWNDLFDYIMAHCVEPRLPVDRPVFLSNYPWKSEVLARRADDLKTRRRWELYLGGIEVANCFAEEQHSSRVSEFMHRQNQLRKDRGSAPVVAAEWVPEALATAEPCAGSALGFDRLLMLLCGEPSIEGVIFFPLHDNLRK